MGQGQRSQSTFSAIYCIKLPNDVDAMVKSSNKNTQELTTNVQEADPDRVNRRELHGQTAPDHRWWYAASATSRLIELDPSS